MSNSTRPSSSSSYDERFVVPLEASRRGAHRARVSPLMAVLPVAAVVGIVVGAITLVYVFLGMGSDDGSEATTRAAAPSATPSAAATTSAEGAATGDGSAGTSAAPGTVDKSITLDVFNGTGTSGLAKRAGTKLTAAGWSTGRVETWTGAPVTQTTVYYASADQKATAQAVVKTLGRGTAKLSASRAGTGMAVVIGPDYPGASQRVTGTTRSPADSTRSSARTDSGATTRSSAAGSTSSSTAEAGATTSRSSADVTPTTTS